MSKTIAWGIAAILFPVYFGIFFLVSSPDVIFSNRSSRTPDSESALPYLTRKPNIKSQNAATVPDMPINTTVTNKSISLFCTVPKAVYQVNSTLSIQFSVTNISSEAIYLITARPEHVYAVSQMKDRNDSLFNNDLYIAAKEFQIYEEHFELPHLMRLAPGEKYTSNVRFRLKNYTSGAKFFAYLSVFYLSERGMAEINQMIGPPPSVKIGPDFRDLEIKLTSLPMSLSIAP